MVVRGKKKYQVGEGSQFLTRKAALKKLQLSLNEFRKLCILKGIYPREPRNRKRAQKGKTGIKILYHIKDIQFLSHEPIIWKLRDYKIFTRKVSRAKAIKDFAAMKRYLSNHPTLKLDHIVKERYPTFIDALRDLDDCLTLCFLFSTFPSMSHIPRDQSILCRRLTVEFMHAVIAAKALRKVFISIKGFYYQAEIKGQLITWIVPHHFSFEPQSKLEVDFRVMSTFVEFYIIMLGFVNYRLYHSLNLFYPPKFNNMGNDEKTLVDEEVYVSERISALNTPLVSLDLSAQKDVDDEEITLDEFTNEADKDKLKELHEEAENIKRLKTLFVGKKFFINREVPREPLVFIIRCFGGEVSWDKLLFVGATFDENDESITHHIVDRPSIEKQYISRYYVQPQWIFDSVNARNLLSVEQYLMGAVLPPHLSPFNNQLDQVYIPPEERALIDPSYKVNDLGELEESVDEDEENNDDDDDDGEAKNEEKENDSDEEIIEASDEDNDEEDKADEVEDKNISRVVSQKNKKNTPQNDEVDKEKLRLKKKQLMKVKAGEIIKEDPWAKDKQKKQEYRLREKMMKKKHRNLYKSMMSGRQDRAKEIWLLRKKRRLYETEEKEKRKQERKNKKTKISE